MILQDESRRRCSVWSNGFHVPQGSILGPLLFYKVKLQTLSESFISSSKSKGTYCAPASKTYGPQQIRLPSTRQWWVYLQVESLDTPFSSKISFKTIILYSQECKNYHECLVTSSKDTWSTQASAARSTCAQCEGGRRTAAEARAQLRQTEQRLSASSSVPVWTPISWESKYLSL